MQYVCVCEDVDVCGGGRVGLGLYDTGVGLWGLGSGVCGWVQQQQHN